MIPQPTYPTLLPEVLVLPNVDDAVAEAEFLTETYRRPFSIVNYGDDQYGVMEKTKAVTSAAVLFQTILMFEVKGDIGGCH